MKLPLIKDKYGTIKDQDGETPLLTGFALSCGPRNQKAEDNTDDIIRAVNSHDALVEALGEIVDKLAEQNMDSGTFFGPSCHKAVCALAAAKGDDQ